MNINEKLFVINIHRWESVQLFTFVMSLRSYFCALRNNSVVCSLLSKIFSHLRDISFMLHPFAISNKVSILSSKCSTNWWHHTLVLPTWDFGARRIYYLEKSFNAIFWKFWAINFHYSFPVFCLNCFLHFVVPCLKQHWYWPFTYCIYNLKYFYILHYFMNCV